ncbi:MAG: trigger factor [Anaerolineae bacterium]|nr:trigger factor [Thermoflexales bacterium]MDW8052922.1 trigger factor [Anaerolineae bacterium]
MNLNVEFLDTHEARLTIIPDETSVQAARDRVLRAINKQVRIPGFRPGHAPAHLVIQAIGGPQVLALEANEQLLKELYPRALEEARINPYAAGVLEDTLQDPLRFVVRVPLQPVVDLKDYRSIRLPFPEVVVSEEEVAEALEDIRRRHAVLEPVERTAEWGDAVAFAVFSLEEGEDKPRLLLEARDDRPWLLNQPKEGEAQQGYVPQIMAMLVGMAAGETKEGTLTAPEREPEADQPTEPQAEAAQPRTMRVRVEVRRVSKYILPELDDALAQAVGAYSSLDELRAAVRAQLRDMKQREAESEYERQALEAFTALAEVKFPPAMLDHELNQVLAEYKQQIQEQEGLPYEEWLKVSQRTDEEIRAELRPVAERRLRRALVVGALVRQEGIQLSEAELEESIEEISRFAAQIGEKRADVRRRYAPGSEARADLRARMLYERALAHMARIARGELESAQAPTGQPAEPVASAQS